MGNFVEDDESLTKPIGRLPVFYYGVGHMLNDITASCWFTYLLLFLTDIGLSPRYALKQCCNQSGQNLSGFEFGFMHVFKDWIFIKFLFLFIYPLYLIFEIYTLFDITGMLLLLCFLVKQLMDLPLYLLVNWYHETHSSHFRDKEFDTQNSLQFFFFSFVFISNIF